MHLVINAIGVKHSGGAVVLLDFLQEALNHQAVTKVSVFCSPRSSRDFDLPDSGRCIELEQHTAESSYLYRMAWSQRVLPRLCAKLKADAFISLVGIGLGGSTPVRTTFIQQSLPFSREALLRLSPQQRLRFRVMRQLMKWSSREAHRVILQTNTMKRWVATDFDLPDSRLCVIQPGPRVPGDVASIAASAPMQMAATGMRLLYVGNDSGYKNLETLIAGMPELRARVPGVTLCLTLPSDHPANQVVGVECVGYLSDVRLWNAYNLADVLVMPSLVETVGLPMLEAMAVGTAVLAADRPYAREITQGAALFFDPLSTADFVDKAQMILSDELLRADMSRQGKQVVSRLEHLEPYKRMVAVAIGASESLSNCCSQDIERVGLSH